MLQKANTNVIGTKKGTNELVVLCLWEKMSFKDRQPCEAFLKAHMAIFRKMLHETCILIRPVMEYLHGEINANGFALVQTEVWVHCHAFDAYNGFIHICRQRLTVNTSLCQDEAYSVFYHIAVIVQALNIHPCSWRAVYVWTLF